jgi:hypothetical protein
LEVFIEDGENWNWYKNIQFIKKGY